MKTTTDTAPICVVVLSWAEGCSLPHVTFYGTAEDAAKREARELADENAAGLAHDARKAARGWRGERTVPRTYQVKRLHGERAARMISLAEAHAFLSEDEADDAEAASVYSSMRGMFA